ncbi:MAG TPA: methyltransferase [Niabella sp.]|nr:methyltransferase [Niabella sp.]
MKVTTDSCLFGAWIAADILKQHKEKNILDIGSGSGLLSLMVAQQNTSPIDAIEIQESDYLQSLENLSSANFTHRITAHYADASHFVFDKQYDFIISNPPFYQNDLKGSKSTKNIAHHEEGLTLLDLAKIIKNNLSSDGWFYWLLPAKRTNDVMAHARENNVFINKIIRVHQTENHSPFRIMVRGSFHSSDLEEEQIIIKYQNEYSDTFRRLLLPYYLNL